LNFEQEYLQNELIDEFQQLQADQHSRQSHNSFISLIKNFAAYPSSKSASSPSKTLANNANTTSILMNTNTSNLMAAEVLSQNVSRILTIKSSAFDHMVKQRTLAAQQKKASIGSVNKVNSQTSSDSSAGSVRLDVQMSKQQSNDSSSSATSTTVSSSVNKGQTERSTSADLDELETRQPGNEVANAAELNHAKDQPIEKEEKRTDFNSKGGEPYLTLSQEDYTEHKSPILQCKFSKDGKYIASVDSNSLIKSKSFCTEMNYR
jgi:hypothetical protein